MTRELAAIERPKPPAIADMPFQPGILAGRLAQSSIDMYARDFAAYLRFAGSREAALDHTTLARWVTHLAEQTQMSHNTINRMLSAVHRLMKEAASQGYITRELALQFAAVDGVRVQAMKTSLKSHARTRIEREDMRRICEQPDTRTLVGLRDAALLAVMASSGCRISEVITLTPGQIVKRGKGYLLMVTGKTDTTPREAPLSAEAYQKVQAWIEKQPVDSEYIFTSFAGRGHRPLAKCLTPEAAWIIVQGYAKRCELEHIKPHDFRRFVGTQLAASDIRVAQKALGHKSIETTARHYVLDSLEPGLTDNLY